MKLSLYTPMLCVWVSILTPPSPVQAEPVFFESIEWATATSDRIIVGKVIKVETVAKHAIVTVEATQTLRGALEPTTGDRNPNVTFVLQEYCSYYAEGWLEDGLPMMFFLVKIDRAKQRDNLPEGFKWVLHDDGWGNSAVTLGKTSRVWPGTIAVFTRKFEYLTDLDGIVKFVSDYARSIPPNPIDESIRVDVPYNTPAYTKVWPPEYPGNAFFLRVPVVERSAEQVNLQETAQEPGWHRFAPFVLGVLGGIICIGYVARRCLHRGSETPR